MTMEKNYDIRKQKSAIFINHRNLHYSIYGQSGVLEVFRLPSLGLG